MDSSSSEGNAEQESQKAKLAMLEAEIEKACQEEDYDRAGEDELACFG